MTALLALAATPWRLLRRDPAALVFTLLMPLTIGGVLAANFLAGEGGSTRVGLVLEARGPVGRELAVRLGEHSVLEIVEYPARAAAEHDVRRQRVAAAVVVPEAVDETGGPADVLLIGPPLLSVPSDVRAAVEVATAETGALVTAAEALEPTAPRDRGLAEARARFDAARPDREVASDTGPYLRNRALGSAVIGSLVLFSYANTMGLSASLVGYRDLGLLTRMRAAPVASWQVSAGYGLGLTSYAVVQALLVLLVGTVAFGVDWGQPLVVLGVVVGVGASAGGLGALTATFLPSTTAGATIAGPVGFVSGMVAGCLWPLEVVSPRLQSLAHLTPQAWAIDALRSMVERGPTRELVIPVAVLALFTLAAGTLAALRLPRFMSHLPD